MPKWKRDLVVSNLKVGDVALSLGEIELAQASFKEAIAISRELAKEKSNTKYRRDLSIALQRLGNLGLKTRNPTLAIESFTESQIIFEFLSKQDKDNTEWQRDVAVNLEKLGHAAKLSGDTKLALARYERTISLRRELVNINSNNVQWRTDLAEALMHYAENSNVEIRASLISEALTILKDLKARQKTGKEQEAWIRRLERIQ